MEIEKVKAAVLKQIKPSEKEIVKAIQAYEELKKTIESELDIEYPFSVELEGSVAKGTALRGEIDLDIFILIKKPDMTELWLRKAVVDKLMDKLTKKFRVQLRYASHPYIRVFMNGIDADIVPAYWADSIEEIRTAVDRTPFHTKYVKERLNNLQKDEARLVKKFFKGLRIYGAEIMTQGFSGYLSELLIIKYGDFETAVEKMSKWREREVIQLGPQEDSKTLKILFRDSPLIFPDPVDPKRNAAAAVSRKSLAIAIVASSLFLKKPSPEFFFPRRRRLPIHEIEKALSETQRLPLFLIYNVAKNTPPDVLWGELKRLSKKIANILSDKGFGVIDFTVWTDESEIAIINIDIDSSSVNKNYEIREGPKILDSSITKFFLKYTQIDRTLGPWINEKGIPYVMIPRRWRNPESCLREYLSINDIEAKDLTLKIITSEIKEVRDKVNKKSREDFDQWLIEAVLKTPSWVGAIKGSGSFI